MLVNPLCAFFRSFFCFFQDLCRLFAVKAKLLCKNCSLKAVPFPFPLFLPEAFLFHTVLLASVCLLLWSLFSSFRCYSPLSCLFLFKFPVPLPTAVFLFLFLSLFVFVLVPVLVLVLFPSSFLFFFRLRLVMCDLPVSSSAFPFFKQGVFFKKAEAMPLPRHALKLNATKKQKAESKPNLI